MNISKKAKKAMKAKILVLCLENMPINLVCYKPKSAEKNLMPIRT